MTSEFVEKEVLACDPALVFTSFCLTCDLFCFAIEIETIPGNVLQLRCVESRENHVDSFKKIFHLQSSF